AITGGYYHSLALKSDGTVWAWGHNNYGQLGDGTTTDRLTPVQVQNLTNIVAIAGGSSHSLALKSDGTVWAWGYNNYGQLGDGTTTNRLTPIQVQNLTNIVAITGGGSHSLALKSDGTVWAWGYNRYGQLGDGTTTNRYVPIQVQNLTNVIAIAGGGSHSLALKSDGTVWAWGRNNYGQLGDGTTTARNTPVQVQNIANVNSVAAGNSHSFAWANCPSFSVYPQITGIEHEPCYGVIISFTLGVPATRHNLYVDGLLVKSNVISPVSYDPEDTYEHSYTIRAIYFSDMCFVDSQPYTFSDTSNSSPSKPTITAVNDLELNFLSGIQIFYEGGSPSTRRDLYMDGNLVQMNFVSGQIYQPGDTKLHFYKIRAINGECYKDSDELIGVDRRINSSICSFTWGFNYYGQLGDGTTTSRETPTQVQNLSDIVTVSGGGAHSLALKSDGTVWAWGNNSSGQLGDGTTTESHEPIQVQNLTNVIDIVCGNVHCLALKSDGTVWAWGNNYYGQLGDGSTIDRYVPVQVSNLTNVVAIAGGWYHSLALKSDGTVWAWGYNYYGQLGDGTTTNRLTPVSVQNLSNVIAIAAGEYHTIALQNAGTVWAWGRNNYGQLGDGTTTNKNIPSQVQNLEDIVSIAVGESHSLALKDDGTVWSWGFNSVGQLGDGTTTNRLTPVQVQNITKNVAVAAGTHHSISVSSCVLITPPVISSIENYDQSCSLKISFTLGSPATKNELWVDSNYVKDVNSSPDYYSPQDNFEHQFMIRAVNGSCIVDSIPISAAETDCVEIPIPPEVAVGNDYVWAGEAMQWNLEPTASGYKVYRGTKNQLENLCNENQDFCQRYNRPNNYLDVSFDDPALIDPENKVLYYLITGYNSLGQE
ncbi:MAG: hypothetical protein GYA35_10490, partial [Thermoanaerobaculaceae bacterium]|nr:hypothetical protein [Thermoanaerobaculaceae bacterium]